MLNKIMLIGNLGKDPDLRYSETGSAIAKFPLAVSRNTKLPSGEWKEETDWFNIVAFKNLAERSQNFLHKGSKVYVEGRLSQRKYTDKNNVERWMVEVVINDLQMLSPKQQNRDEGYAPSGVGSDSSSVDYIEDEQPF